MVLLLDDDDDFRLALAANLIDDGHRVQHFASSAGIEMPFNESVSMLIVDYEMGGEDGLSFADRFHAAHPDVPVVMVTAHSSEFLDYEIAARHFITLRRKPVDYDDLARLMPPPEL
jgi:two-component system nitrogen regulation response regulator GlnG